MQVLVDNVAHRFAEFRDGAQVVASKLEKTMMSIRRKFKDFIQLKIREEMERMVVDPTQVIAFPLKESREIVNVLVRSCELIRDNLFDESEVPAFIEVEWVREYLDKMKNLYNRVYKYIMNSNGTRKARDVDWSDNLYWKLK